MDLLKSQFDRIQQQLAGLSASQKMLAGCLVFIIVMTIGLWGRYAAVPEMEPVIDRALSADELTAVRRQLRASRIPFEIVDSKVMVPSDRLAEAAADLTFSGVLPKSSKIDFQALVKDMNPFTSESTTAAQFNNYKQLALGEVISNFPGVQSANVFLDTTEKPRLTGSVLPTATVSIQMKSGEPVTQKLIDAAGTFIAGSQAALKWDRVTVIVDGVPRRVRDPNSGGIGGTGGYREELEKFEKDLEDRVRQQFSHIPQMAVSVSLKLNIDDTKTHITTYDPKDVIHQTIEESERISESSNASTAAAAEPGLRPNTGAEVNSGGAIAGPSTTNDAETKNKYELLAGKQVKEINTPAGMATATAAAVQIPRSYVSSVIKEENGDGKDPTKAAIQERFNLLTSDIRKSVRAVVGLPSEQDVVVSMYTDVGPQMARLGAGAAAAQGFSPSTVAAVAGAHSRELALGGLAVVSLFMVSMMVRKGNPLPAAAVAMPTMPMPILDASESLAGEVSEGKSMLDAMELDDDAVRAQQMLDQVSSMVEENPDAAAGLVKRWLNRS